MQRVILCYRMQYVPFCLFEWTTGQVCKTYYAGYLLPWGRKVLAYENAVCMATCYLGEGKCRLMKMQYAGYLLPWGRKVLAGENVAFYSSRVEFTLGARPKRSGIRIPGNARWLRRYTCTQRDRMAISDDGLGWACWSSLLVAIMRM